MLQFGPAATRALQRLRSLAETAPVCCVQVVGRGERAGALEQVRDPQGHLRSACRVSGQGWALVRPDSYLAATGDTVDAALVHAVARALGATALERAA